MTAARGSSNLTLLALTLAMLACFAVITVAASPNLHDALAAVSQAEIGMAMSHGELKHGVTAASTIDTCFQQNGTYQEWVNPTTGRHARICKLDNGKFGIQIIEKVDGVWQEITKFVKEKMTCWDQVAQYLKNTGYEPMQ